MVGSGYSLLALGYTLVFGVMKRINLSYGPSIMHGASAETLMKIEDKRSAERTATRLGGGRTVREVIGLLKPVQELILPAALADLNSWPLNTPSGTVDLKSGTLR